MNHSICYDKKFAAVLTFQVILQYLKYIAGWSSLVARRAHNPKVGGSNPPPATI